MVQKSLFIGQQFSTIDQQFFQFRVQICPQKRAICKFSPNFLDNLLPSVREEGFDIGVRDRFAGDFVEPFHQRLHVLDRNLLSGSMVEPVVNLLCGHSYSSTIMRLSFSICSRKWTDVGPIMDRGCRGA